MTATEAREELLTRLDHWRELYRSANRLYGPKDCLVSYYDQKCCMVLSALAILELSAVYHKQNRPIGWPQV